MDLGFNILIPDERSHGLCEGKYIIMGAKERYDLVDWCNFLFDTRDEDIEILVQGISMGAATVCLASNLDLPSQVIGLISDCAYSSFKEQIKYTLKHELHIPAHPLIELMNHYLKKEVGIDLNGENLIDAVADAKVPILFFHGTIDQIVPPKFEKVLYDACNSRKKLVEVEGENHGKSGPSNVDSYFKNITEFFSL